MECPDSKKSAASAAGFPDDALLEILSRLPVKPLRRSKCVSKGWRDLIADPLNRKKLPQTLEGCFFYSRADCYPCGDFRCLEYVHFINLLGTPAAPIVDPSFPSLKELPGISNISLVGSCNGLLLFEHDVEPDMVGRILCNPATGQLVTVPVDPTQAEPYEVCRVTHLIFDPAISSNFNLVTFCAKSELEVHIYSSETGAWSCRLCDWGELYMGALDGAFVNGMLYVFFNEAKDLIGEVQGVIVAVDMEGNKRKIIPVPPPVGEKNYYGGSDYFGQSQGCLHYIYCVKKDTCHAGHAPSELSSDTDTTGVNDKDGGIYGLLLIWVFEDNDTQQWVLKHTVSLLKLFGKKGSFSYSVVAIHPHRNLVFFVNHCNEKLISYDMDSRKCVISAPFHLSMRTSLPMFPTSQSWHRLKISTETLLLIHYLSGCSARIRSSLL